MIDDVATRIRTAFAHSGDAIVLLGETGEELSGSIWEAAVHAGHLGGLPPVVKLQAEMAMARVMGEAARRRLLSSAHDLSEGGLAVALAESAFRGGKGFAVTLPEGDPTVELFAESAARAIVSLSGAEVGEFEALCAEHGVTSTRLGEVTGDPEMEFVGLFTVPLDDAEQAWRDTLPNALN